jgi:hypothetical protein
MDQTGCCQAAPQAALQFALDGRPGGWLAEPLVNQLALLGAF